MFAQKIKTLFRPIVTLIVSLLICIGAYEFVPTFSDAFIKTSVKCTTKYYVESIYFGLWKYLVPYNECTMYSEVDTRYVAAATALFLLR